MPAKKKVAAKKAPAEKAPAEKAPAKKAAPRPVIKDGMPDVMPPRKKEWS